MSSIRQKLLGWYDETARELPWRQTRDPYAIWVSEIMLQQTRVDTVIPYYQRFLDRFPTAQALAEADEDAVLSYWSGLGYYRRARLLHAGVREVVSRYGGSVPDDAEARRSLPGVGPYTAGAIGSIAFDREEPIVDGNVTRVLARLFRIATPVGASATTRRLWEEAARLVSGERPGAFNQALMELGATVCTPRRVLCDRCPLRAHCEAYQHGEVEAFPVSRTRKAPKEVKLSAVVATRGRGASRSVWLVRGRKALFGGLWSVPMSEGTALSALAEAGLRARPRAEPVTRLQHILTHRRLQVEVYLAAAASGASTEDARLFRPTELGEVGVSSLTRKILQSAALRVE